MKKPRQYSWIMKTSKKAVSVNASYRAVIKNGHPQLFKTKEAREYISELTHQIELLDVPDWIHEKDMSFKMYIKVLFREGYYSRDLDNILKATIDATARAKTMSFNDSRIVHIECDKQLLKGAPHETIIVNLTENLSETDFDADSGLPRPLEIFLGGTCSGTRDWRAEVIPWLTERRYGYYNPLITDRDWDISDKIAEDDYKENKADCMFFMITPDQKGLYSVAEIFSEISQVREGNFGTVLVGFLGTEADWGEAGWKSVLATRDEIRKLSGGSKHIVAECIQEPLELCRFLDENGWKGKRKPKN